MIPNKQNPALQDLLISPSNTNTDAILSEIKDEM
jgi:hypothetical protein